MFEVLTSLEVERDHIGLYPRIGAAAENTQVPLVYTLTIPEGNGTLNTSAEHPLTAPIKKQLADGSPGGNWRYIVAKRHQSHYIIGAVNVTPGNRLLFFPSNYNVQVQHNEQPQVLDHITLESRSTLKSKRSNGDVL